MIGYHRATILKSLRRDLKATEKHLERNKHYAKVNKVPAIQPKWEASVKRSEEKIEELTATIEYMESLPITIGGSK